MSADMSKREQNPGEFIRTTLTQQLRSNAKRTRGTILGIDEGLNHRQIESLSRRLLQMGTISQSVPLWYQQRIDVQGQRFSVTGSSLSPSTLMPDVGRAVRGASWPDERVVALLVAHFLSYDRLCLLTQNTKNDKSGLRRILTDEVAPAIEAFEAAPIGLLVLAQSPAIDLSAYTAAVEARLSESGVPRGFTWTLVE